MIDLQFIKTSIENSEYKLQAVFNQLVTWKDNIELVNLQWFYNGMWFLVKQDGSSYNIAIDFLNHENNIKSHHLEYNHFTQNGVRNVHLILPITKDEFFKILMIYQNVPDNIGDLYDYPNKPNVEIQSKTITIPDIYGLD